VLCITLHSAGVEKIPQRNLLDAWGQAFTEPYDPLSTFSVSPSIFLRLNNYTTFTWFLPCLKSKAGNLGGKTIISSDPSVLFCPLSEVLLKKERLFFKVTTKKIFGITVQLFQIFLKLQSRAGGLTQVVQCLLGRSWVQIQAPQK
jgi:hypothetical protein